MPQENPVPRQDPLPDDLPADPMPLFAQWFEAARVAQSQPNPDAMVLATATVDGRPSARVVLLKKGGIVADGNKEAMLTVPHLTGLFDTPVQVVEVNGWYQILPGR